MKIDDVKRKKLLIITNVDWFLISHRLVLAKAAAKAGWSVYVACEDTGRSDEIAVDGITFVPITISRSGLNPFQEYKTYRSFIKIYRNIVPDVVHQITIKPVVYGGLAARRLGVNGVVNAISGLGYMFVGNRLGFVQKMILKLMKRGLDRSNVAIIFQNEDDKAALQKADVLRKDINVALIKGSGIDLEEFKFAALPSAAVRIRVLFPARMLWDKGIRELREASEILKEKYSNRIQFVLVGMADGENKAGVSLDYLLDWSDGNYVTWLGHRDDMIALYEDCHLVVLPSYREGLPKSLIEACAIGRAIVTTDAIGCKECVDEGINGFKVPVGDGKALAIALEKMILNPTMLERMGVAGRKKAELEFDVKDVIDKHLEIYKSLLT